MAFAAAKAIPPGGTIKCGCSSSGRAPPCQGGGSEFEPRQPLQKRKHRLKVGAFCFIRRIIFFYAEAHFFYAQAQINVFAGSCIFDAEGEDMPHRGVFGRLRRPGGCRCPPTGAKGDRTPYGFLSPLDSPYLPFKLRLPAVAQRNARGPQGRLVLQGYTLDGSGAFRSGTRPPCTVWPRTGMRGKPRKRNSGQLSCI